MKHSRIISLVVSALIALTMLCSCEEWFDGSSQRQEGTLVCHFLDVGQGDSAYIELPNNQTMLIDSGENYHGKSILQYIRDTGHNRIDYLIATHPHSDHIGSMAYIVRNFDIGTIYMPKVGSNSNQYESLLKAVKSKKLTIQNGKAGVNILSDSDLQLTADIVAPVKIVKENLNNSSIVMKLKYKKSSFLFTGDAEKAELATITGDIKADVLKVGHHGSSTSTTKDFVNKVDPQIAVISCGIDNDYGHPHKTTLKYLKQNNCEIHRTDKEGTVSVTSGGRNYTVKTGIHSIERAR
ncbi:MAG: ComEC/Rec2 family competence protein [Ruminococcus sp.]|nr:ComEC/Rec2 family competence protein [Ruminococcus sp.]